MASTEDSDEKIEEQTPAEQAQDDARPAGEEAAAEQPEDSGEPQVESSDPLAYIDSTQGQRSRAKCVEEGLDEAVLLLKAGWKPYGPYQPKREGDKPFMYMQQTVGSKGRVFYVMGENMDDDGVETIYAQSPDAPVPGPGRGAWRGLRPGVGRPGPEAAYRYRDGR
ncbi:MAG: hypothetical protein ACRD1T_11500 [Acidimicrobiia bacterium]